MTDRLKGCVVVFDKEYRVDDAESIVSAIKMVKGVANVEVSVATPEDYMNRERVAIGYSKVILEALRSMRGTEF